MEITRRALLIGLTTPFLAACGAEPIHLTDEIFSGKREWTYPPQSKDIGTGIYRVKFNSKAFLEHPEIREVQKKAFDFVSLVYQLDTPNRMILTASLNRLSRLTDEITAEFNPGDLKSEHQASISWINWKFQQDFVWDSQPKLIKRLRSITV